jgi:hypothetical protein
MDQTAPGPKELARWRGDMAILILPIGVALGWYIRRPGRAAAVTAAVGLVGLAVLGVLALTGAEVSPLETFVLILATPISAVLALKIAQWRRSTASSPTAR